MKKMLKRPAKLPGAYAIYQPFYFHILLCLEFQAQVPDHFWEYAAYGCSLCREALPDPVASFLLLPYSTLLYVVVSDRLFFRVPVLVLIFTRQWRLAVRLLLSRDLIIHLAVFCHGNLLFRLIVQVYCYHQPVNYSGRSRVRFLLKDQRIDLLQVAVIIRSDPAVLDVIQLSADIQEPSRIRDVVSVDVGRFGI